MTYEDGSLPFNYHYSSYILKLSAQLDEVSMLLPTLLPMQHDFNTTTTLLHGFMELLATRYSIPIRRTTQRSEYFLE